MGIIVFVEITVLPIASHPENCEVGSEKLKAVCFKEGREETSLSHLFSLRPQTLLLNLAQLPSVPRILQSSTLTPRDFLPSTPIWLASLSLHSGVA